MRRAFLLAAALAVPSLGAAQAVPTGQIQFVEPGTTNDITHGQWIGATKCANQATTNVVLQWTIQLLTGATFRGQYQIYAANQAMAANATECPKISNTGTGLVAGAVGDPITAQYQSMNNVQQPVQKFLAAVQQTSCSITSQVTIHVCVELQDTTAGNKMIGVANGQLYFSVAKPNAPPSVSVGPLETGKLQVNWTQPSGDPKAYDYIVRAHSVTSTTDLTKDPKDTTDHQVGPTDQNASQATLGGLTDGVLYAVYVSARSVAQNESDPAGPAFGTPQPVADFWDQYRSTPGAVEQGGCSTAGAGPLALLGLAALAAALRRRT